jgi:hypothetical protein
MAEQFWDRGPEIDGLPGRVGDLVFWDGKKPWWIAEWQPQNGRVFVVVDASGTIGTASPEELTRDFRRAPTHEELSDD